MKTVVKSVKKAVSAVVKPVVTAVKKEVATVKKEIEAQKPKAVKPAVAKKVEPTYKFKVVPINFKNKPLKNVSASIFAIILHLLETDFTKNFESLCQLCEASGLPYLKNKGSATESNQIFLKAPAKQAFEYLVQFKKCVEGSGNKKTQKAYEFALKKMNPASLKYCLEVYSKSFGTDYAKLRHELLAKKEMHGELSNVGKMMKMA